MNKNRISTCGSVLTAALIFAARFGVSAVAPSPVPGPRAPAIMPNPSSPGLAGASSTDVKQTPSYLTFTYYGDKYRDPFIPLTGDMHSADLLDRAPQISSLVLKGIVQDANGRMALLVSGVNAYILRNGRLYDGRNRAVKKISGVIKVDSVVLIGSDRTVRELKTRAEL